MRALSRPLLPCYPATCACELRATARTFQPPSFRGSQLSHELASCRGVSDAHRKQQEAEKALVAVKRGMAEKRALQDRATTDRMDEAEEMALAKFGGLD